MTSLLFASTLDNNMADECVAGRESVEKKKQRNKKPLNRESPDRDLQTIFKKLRVDNRPKRLQRRARSRSLSMELENIHSNHKRCVLRKPTFVYKREHLRQSKKSKVEASIKVVADSNTDNKPAVSGATSTKPATVRQSKSNVELRDFVSGCGQQHRRAQSVGSCTDLHVDDTTPEELAAYFEQLLHIPKPMSAMAEMMYT